MNGVAAGAVTAASARELTVEGRYLQLPVEHGSAPCLVSLSVGGVKVREFGIELAAAEPDYWVFADVGEWLGQELLVEVDGLPDDATALDRIETTDSLRDEAGFYSEPLRPRFHFSSRRGRLNDPNGLLHYDGTYHLFYQHNPYGCTIGKHCGWGHATSTDLVHWEEEGDVLHPDASGACWSGSGVVDWQNTSGLGTGDDPPLVLAYTMAGGRNPWSEGEPFGIGLAFSGDGGRTWAKFSGNPVLEERAPLNRDPKVLWHEATKRWVMVLYVGYPEEGRLDPEGRPLVRHGLELFSSPDLRNWAFRSRIEGLYECPDLFELPLDGDREDTRWILTGGNLDYLVGSFDGEAFTPETSILQGNSGRPSHGHGEWEVFYGGQTFSNMPDGRTVQIGWGQVPMPGMPFDQQLFFPSELTLSTTPEGPRLAWKPIREIESLHGSCIGISDHELVADGEPLSVGPLGLYDLALEIAPRGAAEIGLTIGDVTLFYEHRSQTIRTGDLEIHVPLRDGRLDLRVLVDRMSIEIYAAGGCVYLPIRLEHPPTRPTLELAARRGTVTIRSLTIFELSSIWGGNA